MFFSMVCGFECCEVRLEAAEQNLERQARDLELAFDESSVGNSKAKKLRHPWPPICLDWGKQPQPQDIEDD